MEDGEYGLPAVPHACQDVGVGLLEDYNGDMAKILAAAEDGVTTNASSEPARREPRGGRGDQVGAPPPPPHLLGRPNPHF